MSGGPGKLLEDGGFTVLKTCAIKLENGSFMVLKSCEIMLTISGRNNRNEVAITESYWKMVALQC